MKDYIKEGALNHISDLRGFETMHNACLEKGYVRNIARVTRESRNLRGTAHGGFLLALSDTTACMAGYTCGKRNMTLQCNFNFIKGVEEGETFSIEAQVIHDGRSTQIVEVDIKNTKDVLCAKATFTLFVIGVIDPNDPIPESPCGRNLPHM